MKVREGVATCWQKIKLLHFPTCPGQTPGLSRRLIAMLRQPPPDHPKHPLPVAVQATAAPHRHAAVTCRLRDCGAIFAAWAWGSAPDPPRPSRDTPAPGGSRGNRGGSDGRPRPQIHHCLIILTHPLVGVRLSARIHSRLSTTALPDQPAIAKQRANTRFTLPSRIG